MSRVESDFRPNELQDARGRLLLRVEGEYVAHLEGLEQVFNSHARRLGLGVRIDVSKAAKAARNFETIRKISNFLDRADDSGVLHDGQLMTALDCVAEILTEPGRNGLVVGAMQSGKTTTSLALQFAGPIVYLLTGRALYPVYLITSHTSQEDQTKIELKKFLDFYGDIEVVVDAEHRCTLIEYTENLGLDLIFEVSPTIETYRHNVLNPALPDTYMGPTLEDFVQRRVHGGGVQRVADLCRRAGGQGFSPLLMIDEPQYGASDRPVPDGAGGIEWRSCVLNRIFEAIERELGEDTIDHVFIGMSATPYELVGVDAVWQVKQYLTSDYVGFNYFCGEVIDGVAEVTPPVTLSFTEYSRQSGIPFFAMIDLATYGGSSAAFDRFCRKREYEGNHARYRARVEDALRAAIYDMAGAEDEPTGICVRLFNDNRRSHALLARLGLNPERVEVIEWFGSEFRGQSVKRAIENRRRKDLPFVIAVTNRARMGDAFPKSVKWFIDFSRQASTLNALLQGLLGRACGYGKESTVILSDENAQLVDDYKSTRGGLIYNPSPHSVVVGAYRRGAPTSVLKVSADADDPIVRRFFERLNSEVVDNYVEQNERAFRPSRTRGNDPRRVPILQIAEEVGLFDHLESFEVRQRLYPTFADGFRIARAGDVVERSRTGEAPIGYDLDEAGNIRFSMRWNPEESPGHAGIQSRGYGARDAADRARAGNKLEPQIHLRKRDLETGEIIFDKNEPELQRPGRWEARALILPLVRPVRELKTGDQTLPKEHGAYSKLLTDAEKKAAGYSES